MNKLIIILFSIFCISIFYRGDLPHFSSRVYITSIVIQIFAIYKVFIDSKIAFSLKKMFYLFNFFFFGVAPLLQFYEKYAAYGGKVLKEENFFHLNIVIIVIMILYEVFYSFFIKSVKVKNHVSERNVHLSRKQIVILMFVSIVGFLVTFYTNDFDVVSMMVRGGDLKRTSEISSTALSLFLGQVFRPMPMISLFFVLLDKKVDFKIKALFFILAVATIFPMGVPRFFAAALYIPLLLILFPILSRKNLFSIIFVLGLLIIFPFLDKFRGFERDEKLELGFDFKMFNSGHFDSYQNFANIVVGDIVTYGQQLIGVIFFWVPRSIWPTKPVGSGTLLANKLNLVWDNISANFFAEGYINFGYPGILLFIVVIALYSAKLDKKYWSGGYMDNSFKIIYMILNGMIFFMLRGDLLSSTAFTVGFLGSYIIIKRFARLSL